MILRNRKEVEFESEKMLNRARRELIVDRRKIKVIYEGERKLNIEFETLDEKLNALMNRRHLKGSDIWIEDDRIRMEIEVQKWLRSIAPFKRRKVT